MSELIFIGVAWPYANGPLHLGQIAGANLPADIFARYHRLKGNKVLMVSGTDQHGTPVTIRAEQEGKTPQQVVDNYHSQYLDVWKRLGISYDLYTTTGTSTHRKVVQDIFLNLYEKGLLSTKVTEHPYCQQDGRFLADRYVEGTCPLCNNPLARGDQCELCGKPLSPGDLIDWRCRICGKPPLMKDSEHFFLRLTSFQETLAFWLKQAEGRWRPNVYNFTLGWLNEGLQDRAVTRDITWGIPTPIPGYEEKCIYVWFEAVIGYLSASIEWAENSGNIEAWRPFWEDHSSKAYYFLGKDNIPFHTIIWPSMLMGYGDYQGEKGLGKYNLPYDVPANEFLSLEGRKLSTSQNWAVWATDYLDRFDPDPLRYYLSATMPETSDSDFSWTGFIRRNNDELVATYGNLVHRILTLTHKNFDGKVPNPYELDEEDKLMLSRADEALSQVDEALKLCHFKEALGKGMALAAACNRYVDLKAPWKAIKEHNSSAATTLWVSISVLSALKTIQFPFLPFSSSHLHKMLGFSGKVEEVGWRIQPVEAGQPLQTPLPLFSKLEDTVAEIEIEKLRLQSSNS